MHQGPKTFEFQKVLDHEKIDFQVSWSTLSAAHSKAFFCSYNIMHDAQLMLFPYIFNAHSFISLATVAVFAIVKEAAIVLA